MAVLPTPGRPIAPVSKPMLGGRPLVGPIQAGTTNPGLNAMRRAATVSRAGSMQRAFTPQVSGPQQRPPGRLLGSPSYPRNGGFPGGRQLPGAMKPRLTPGTGQLQPINRPVTNPLVPRRPNPGSMIPGRNPGMVPPPRKNPGMGGQLKPTPSLGFPGQYTGPGGIPIDERTAAGRAQIRKIQSKPKPKLGGQLKPTKPKPKPKPGGNLKPQLKPPLTKAQKRARAFKLIRQGKEGRRSRKALASRRGNLRGGPRSNLSITPELLRRIARQQIGRQ